MFDKQYYENYSSYNVEDSRIGMASRLTESTKPQKYTTLAVTPELAKSLRMLGHSGDSIQDILETLLRSNAKDLNKK